MISAKFVPLKYYTLSSQLQRLTSFSVGCSGRRILSPGQIAVMRKWSIILRFLNLISLWGWRWHHYVMWCISGRVNTRITSTKPGKNRQNKKLLAGKFCDLGKNKEIHKGNPPILEGNLPCWREILPSLQGNKHFFQAWAVPSVCKKVQVGVKKCNGNAGVYVGKDAMQWQSILKVGSNLQVKFHLYFPQFGTVFKLVWNTFWLQSARHRRTSLVRRRQVSVVQFREWFQDIRTPRERLQGLWAEGIHSGSRV